MLLLYSGEASFVLLYGPLGAIIMGFIVLCLLCLTIAPYGRYQNSAFGKIVPARIAWILQETPSAAAIIWFYFGSPSHHTVANTVLVIIFVTHYIYRSWIYPFMLRSPRGFPLGTFLGAFVWCLYNGYTMGRYFGEFGPTLSSSHLSSPIFVIGFFLWILGFTINIHSDYTLIHLRKEGETGYKIPTGGAFNYVSGANYLGEILEWAGFALATGGALPVVSFAVFTICNIGPRAFHHHAWYLKTFGDKYPKHRKALIPFIC